jgi:hypothetical protein
MTSEDRELIEAWRAVANAKLAEYRRQCWRLALLVRRGVITKATTVERLWDIATAHALVPSAKPASKPSSMKRLQAPTSGPFIRRSHEMTTKRQRKNRLPPFIPVIKATMATRAWRAMSLVRDCSTSSYAAACGTIT